MTERLTLRCSGRTFIARRRLHCGVWLGRRYRLSVAIILLPLGLLVLSGAGEVLVSDLMLHSQKSDMKQHQDQRADTLTLR